jgi:hypothetical protein
MLSGDEQKGRIAAARLREQLYAHHLGWGPMVFRIGSDEIIADAILQAVREERKAHAVAGEERLARAAEVTRANTIVTVPLEVLLEIVRAAVRDAIAERDKP